MIMIFVKNVNLKEYIQTMTWEWQVSKGKIKLLEGGMLHCDL